jgi:hypothetical protein
MLALRIASTAVKKSSLETILKLSSAAEEPPLMLGARRKSAETTGRPVFGGGVEGVQQREGQEDQRGEDDRPVAFPEHEQIAHDRIR